MGSPLRFSNNSRNSPANRAARGGAETVDGEIADDISPSGMIAFSCTMCGVVDALAMVGSTQ